MRFDCLFKIKRTYKTHSEINISMNNVEVAMIMDCSNDGNHTSYDQTPSKIG